MRQEAETLIIDKEPLVQIFSVMCRDRSILMNINWVKMGNEERERAREIRMANARMHIASVCKLALTQHRPGRYFVHEHPALARSWLEKRTLLICNSVPAQRSSRLINAGADMYADTVMEYSDQPNNTMDGESPSHGTLPE